MTDHARTSAMPYCDVHLHLQVRTDGEQAAFEEVRAMHSEGARVLVFYRTDVEGQLAKRYAALAAHSPVAEVRSYGSAPNLFTRDRATWLAMLDALGRPRWLRFFPQLIFPEQMTLDRLEAWRQEGCAGIKIVDPTRDVPGADAHVGGELGYRTAVMGVLEYCAEFGLPVSLHASLKHHADWVARALEQWPELRINFAHFGHSRAATAELLTRWPHRTFTDVANLNGPATDDAVGYAAFMERFPHQVIFGSDGFLGDLSAVRLHRAMIQRLLPARMASRILLDNGLRFLGHAAVNEREWRTARNGSEAIASGP